MDVESSTNLVLDSIIPSGKDYPYDKLSPAHI